MKKTVAVLAGVLALGIVVYVSSRLMAQTAAPTVNAAAGRGTRIATINLAYVLKNYEKFKTLDNELKIKKKDFDDRLVGKAKVIEQYGQEAKTTTTPGRKEELEKSARGVQREMEDIQNEAKAFFAKKMDEQIVQLYREVQDAAQRYALPQGIDLVLTYTDATTQADYYNPAYVARKMNSAGCMPIYAAQGTDISQEVVVALNAAFGRTATPTPGAGAGAAVAPR